MNKTITMTQTPNAIKRIYESINNGFNYKLIVFGMTQKRAVSVK